MRVALHRHPDSLCPTVKWIVVEATRPTPTALRLHFKLAGDIESLRLPPKAEAARTPGLWQHTCFELFLRAGTGADYLEFNFSPSTQWAAYAFGDYRSGAADAPLALRPAIRFVASSEGLALVAQVDGLPAEQDWTLGLAAVIEDKDGRKSYWALAHPPGEPDFHHETCFALELPAAG